MLKDLPTTIAANGKQHAYSSDKKIQESLIGKLWVAAPNADRAVCSSIETSWV